MGRGTQNALKRLTFPVAAVALIAALLLTAPLGAEGALAHPDTRCARANGAPNEATLQYLRNSVLCLVNRARERFGLQPLHANADLRRSATGHSNDMVANDYFSHYGPDGSTPSGRVARSGYLVRSGAYLLGENIGFGMGRTYGSPLAIFRAWMHSPPHRANILDPRFRDFGIGVAHGFPGAGGADAATYTLDFGFRW